jgi:1-acyl-sn-glycerol-3-phosphate acyltransferase
VLIFIFIFYLPLAIKAISSLTRFGKLVEKFPLRLGHIEYFIAPFRDTLLSYFLAIYGIYRLITNGDPLLSILFIGLSLFSQLNRLHSKKFRKAFCQWVLKSGTLEPHYFFQTYYRGLGSFLIQLPAPVKMLNHSSVDYRTGKPSRKTLRPLLGGALDTATLAKLALFGMKHFEGEMGINMFDTLARIWGATFAFRSHLKLQTTGVDKLPVLHGKILLVFNHKSYLDFALNFFALGDIQNKGRHLRPRFIAAKDHFIDNPLIYSWLGLGKCIEKAGMIFINRQKGKGWLAMKEAADKLTESDVEVAVYPQGTRAWGLSDEKENRIDAGYYTTFSKKTFNDPRGHLKSGTAQLILDTALRLREKGAPPLQVLFVGIDGTATVGPKGSFLIQTESEVTFRIGSCWTVNLPNELKFENPSGAPPTTEAHENYLDELKAIHLQLDHELEKTIERHKTLIERVLNDPRIPQQNILEVENYLRRADETENIFPFVILDRIYALPCVQWEIYLKDFAQFVLEDADEMTWKELNKKVSEELIHKK